jgi:hypothetical protein
MLMSIASHYHCACSRFRIFNAFLRMTRYFMGSSSRCRTVSGVIASAAARKQLFMSCEAAWTGDYGLRTNLVSRFQAMRTILIEC